MNSDFSIARERLEAASRAIAGADDTSRRCRLAIDILIEAISKAEHSQPSAQIVSLVRYRKSAR